jgi:hypothetical protein
LAVAYQLGELVDRLGGLHQGLGSCFIDLPDPEADGICGDEEGFGSLLQGPRSGSAEFKDGHAFGGGIVRSAGGRDQAHPDVFDSQLVFPEAQFLPESVVFSLKADALIGAIGGPTATVGQGILSEGHDVEDSGFDADVPALGERDLRRLGLTGHLDLQGDRFLGPLED